MVLSSDSNNYHDTLVSSLSLQIYLTLLFVPVVRTVSVKQSPSWKSRMVKLLINYLLNAGFIVSVFGWGQVFSRWNPKSVICNSVVFRYMHECTWVMYSSVSVKRSNAGWVKTGGSNGAIGALTASTYVPSSSCLCLFGLFRPQLHILSSFPSSVYLSSTSFNSVETLKSKQQIISKGQYCTVMFRSPQINTRKWLSSQQVENYNAPLCLST